MYKLKFLLARYARPAYRWLAVGLALAALAAIAAWFTPLFEPVAIALGIVLAALAGAAATLGVVTVNVVVAAGLQRRIDHFEAAYDAYRRANDIPDIFYAALDEEEAAAENGA